MVSSEDPKHEIYEGTVLDVDRHAGNEVPTAAVPKPQVGGSFELNSAVANGRVSCFRTGDWSCTVQSNSRLITR